MRLFAAAVLAGLAAGTAVPAQAAISVVGGNAARECFEKADFGRSLDSALSICNRAVEETALTLRDRAATLVNRGIVHMRMRHYRAAIRDYDAALKLDGSLAEAFINKGIALVHEKREIEAIPLLTHGLTLQPSRPEVAYYTRAVAHEMAGDARSAYNDYQAAAALKPDWDDPKQQLTRFSVVRGKGA